MLVYATGEGEEEEEHSSIMTLSESNVLIAANSQGTIKVLSPPSHLTSCLYRPPDLYAARPGKSGQTQQEHPVDNYQLFEPVNGEAGGFVQGLPGQQEEVVT
ncbi:hypothetical protein H671_5g13713 [Cricetulus griseus]|nr:hypothetical protein H671_5g13713 [Cricetulus griseus]